MHFTEAVVFPIKTAILLSAVNMLKALKMALYLLKNMVITNDVSDYIKFTGKNRSHHL
jgi:hypothetical protein